MKPEIAWSNYWENYKPDPDYDAITASIFGHLSSVLGSLNGKRLLECGSGTGRISALLSKSGAGVSLLDYSEKAIELSREFFRARGLSGSFTVGDMFAMPYEANTFDAVWSSGVLEHFSPERQVLALKEMLRVCRPGGLLIMLNPSAKAIFYRAGKFLAETAGRWEYGKENPVGSMKRQISEAGAEFTEEHAFGFGLQLVFLRYMPVLGGLLAWALRRLVTEKAGLKLFGGYLLVSVCKKKAN